ncbi:TetR/AcrR family transcriptional regulator [Taklimakanibacter deserti]|uniref:TetR/AcrR family transcriptional regulator n=1 Tax=Taklimakanibacter deserti TaxID=2267839 RepID=UPI000E64E3C5
MPKRGRPIEYDPEAALASARDVFWATGFAASSLDALSEATGMNRPSLAGAFGDKETLYIATLEQYRDAGVVALKETLNGSRPLARELAQVYAKSIDIYLGSDDAAKGCLLIGTASVEAVCRPAIRRVLSESLTAFTAIIEERLRKAVRDGEIARNADAAALAQIAGAILHSLAVRARAGEPRKALDKLAKTAVELICS